MASDETPGAVPQLAPPQAAPPAAQGTNVLAVMGLIAGILSLVAIFAMWIPIIGAFVAGGGVVLATLGIVLSIVARKKAYQGVGGAGTALGGLIVSIVGLVLSLAFGACQLACYGLIKNQQTRFENMTPEEREELFRTQKEQHERVMRGFGNALEEERRRQQQDRTGASDEPEEPEPQLPAEEGSEKKGK